MLPIFYRIILQLGKTTGENSGHSMNSGIAEKFQPSGISEMPCLPYSRLSALLIIASSAFYSHTLCYPDSLLSKPVFGVELNEVKDSSISLEAGFWYLSGTDYAELTSSLDSDIDVFHSGVNIAAVMLACVLINRHITYTWPSAASFNGQPGSTTETRGTSIPGRPIALPERLVSHLIEFPCRIGVEFLRDLPAFITVELMITLSYLRKEGLTIVPEVVNSKWSQAWLILVSSLVDRVTPLRVSALFRTPGFAAEMHRPDLVWIQLAQKMISVCHQDDLLYSCGTAELLEKTYLSLSHIWTVWFAYFLQGDHVKLLERLLSTFSSLLQTIKKEELENAGPSVSEKGHYEKMAAYMAEKLTSWTTGITCSLIEFFESKEQLADMYISMVDLLIQYVPDILEDVFHATRLCQQFLDLLLFASKNGTSSQGTALSSMRGRVLMLLLRCFTRTSDVILSKTVSLLCSTLIQHRQYLPFFYRTTVDGTTACVTMEKYCDSLQLSPLELDYVICLGALVLTITKLTLTTNSNVCSKLLSEVVFTDHLAILALLRRESQSPSSRLAVAAGLVCLIQAFSMPTCRHLLWPAMADADNQEYYYELFLCLCAFMMDPLEEFTKYLAIKVYGCLLQATDPFCASYQSIHGSQLLTCPWNNVILDQLLADIDLDQPLPKLTMCLIEFVITLFSTHHPYALLITGKRLIRILLMLSLHNLKDYRGEVNKALQRFAFVLSESTELDLLSNTERICIQSKISCEASNIAAVDVFILFKVFIDKIMFSY